MQQHGNWKRLGDGSLLTQDADEGLGHILPFKTYVYTLSALLALTMLTVAVAQFEFGAMNVVVAIAVASIKALLVALFFMHLRYEKRLLIIFAVYPLLLLALLIGGTFDDVALRETVEPLGRGVAAEHPGTAVPRQ